MNESPIDLDTAVALAEGQLHPWVLQTTTPAARRDALRDELRWAVEEATVNRGYAREFHEGIPVVDATDDDYLNRWIRVASDLSILAGPRFRARDRSRPFVALDLCSRQLTPVDLPEVATTLRNHFDLFRPRSFVFWDQAPSAMWAGAAGDMRLVAGRISTIRRRTFPADLTAIRPAELTFYERYAAEVDAMLDAQPWRREWTRRESRETMSDLLETGTVREVLIGGQWAGLVAGRRGSHRGVQGIYVVEMFLSPTFRGRGYGAALSVVLARAAPNPAVDIVHGTIHWGNQAALRAAFRSGRRDIGGEVVVPFAGP